MGASVYLAHDSLLNKKVAIKVLAQLDSKKLVLFQDEARATSALKHPAIVNVLDFGMTSGSAPYMVLEYVQGRSLEEVLRQEGRLDWETCVSVFEQICGALQFAHDRGVFHRDLKPANILLSGDGNGLRVFIIDFGIAKVRASEKIDNQSPTIAGTPLYFSPDVGLGRSYDARSEVYSLGCVLFEALTGEPPFQGSTALHTLSLHANAPIPRLPDEFDSIPRLQLLITRALAKEPDDRFQSMSEFARALGEITQDDIQRKQKLTSDRVNVYQKPAKKISTLAFPGMVLVILVALVTQLINGRRTPNMVANLKARASAGRSPLAGAGTDVQAELSQKEPITEAADDNSFASDLDPEMKKKLNALESKFIRETKWEWQGGSVTGRHVTDEDFKQLKPAMPISAVLLTIESGATGTGFAYLKGNPLRNVDVRSPNFDDEGALALAQFKSITRMCVNHSRKLTDKGVAYLASLPELSELQLRFMHPVPPSAIRMASRCKSLTHFDLANSTGLNVADFKLLKTMPKLATLNLSGSSINDEAMAYISQLKLKRLDIANTQVTDRGLELAAGMKTLGNLTISTLEDCISEKALTAFRHKRPDCELVVADELRTASKLFAGELKKVEQLNAKTSKKAEQSMAKPGPIIERKPPFD